MKKEYVQLDGVLYSISGNTHPECERIKMELIKLQGIDPFELLGRCPEKYRCLDNKKLLERTGYILIPNITLYTNSTLSKILYTNAKLLMSC